MAVVQASLLGRAIMKLKAILVLALPLLPMAARAEDRNVPAMLSVARACLEQIGALRGSDVFQRHDMRSLIRKVASDIDYAETWVSHDAMIAASYLAATVDCDNTIAVWSQAHGPNLMPLHRPETVKADVGWILDRGHYQDLREPQPLPHRRD
ncbi:MAG: hypothetical protein K2X44_07940, partial [Magnetospirillum sp.]|nr:hypothetical protein [Magnetospirillum sp.]